MRVDSFETFVEQARSQYGDRYEYPVNDYSNGHHTVVRIRCIDHGTNLEVKIRNHLRQDSGGCPGCSRELRLVNRDDYVVRAREIHGERFDYDHIPDRFLVTDYIDIRCRTHGPVRHMASRHIGGRSCRKCVRTDLAIEKKRQSAESILAEFKNIHGERYDYSKVEYVSSQTYVTIVCREHGDFVQIPTAHKRGSGCPTCGKIQSAAAIFKTQEMFVEQAKRVHGSMYDYSDTQYVGARDKLSIKCPKHGSFSQTAGVHLAGHGCPRCSGGVSRAERHWLDGLGVEIRHYAIAVPGAKRKVVVDGYDPDSNTVYQFHGDFWHGNPAIYDGELVNRRTGTTFASLYKNTQERDALIVAAGFNLVVMWEREYKNSLSVGALTSMNRHYVKEDGDKKDEILALPADAPRPHSRTPIGSYYHRFINPRNLSFDPDFLTKVKAKYPGWFVKTVVENKKYFRSLPPLSPKPTGKMMGLIHNYTQRYSECYDAEFDSDIRRAQPEWFAKTARITKANIRALPVTTPQRPQISTTVGRCFANYICKSSPQYDSTFDDAVRKRFPHWFVIKKWEFVSPTGEIFVVDQIKEFCERVGLNPKSASRVARGGRSSTRGWTARRIT
jgi:G:T-mismatch repair DNA endonuclease (very short patch repair protein)